MTNNIKHSGEDGLALQVTKPARSAELVKENADGEPTKRASVRVHAFDNLLLVLDRDRVTPKQAAELVQSAAGDTSSIYRGMNATVQIAGNGYQVQLPPAPDAGFRLGDRAPCHAAPHILLISTNNRLARDLQSIREHQVN